MSAKDGLSLARESAVVPGRMCSSWSRTTRPLRSCTGTTERSKRPSFQAAAARSWESAAYSSTSRREKPSMVAMRSAPMPCGTKSVSKLVIGSANQAPPSEAIGTRDIDSTPPARTRSSQPERTLAAAMLTASRPEAQKRFSWTPATVSGQPGGDGRDPGDVGALVADRADDAEHDVVDGGRVEVRGSGRGSRG